MCLFSQRNVSKYYTHTSSFRKDHSRVDWLFVVKTKLRGCVKVVQDGNDELTIGDDLSI